MGRAVFKGSRLEESSSFRRSSLKRCSRRLQTFTMREQGSGSLTSLTASSRVVHLKERVLHAALKEEEGGGAEEEEEEEEEIGETLRTPTATRTSSGSWAARAQGRASPRPCSGGDLAHSSSGPTFVFMTKR